MKRVAASAVSLIFLSVASMEAQDLRLSVNHTRNEVLTCSADVEVEPECEETGTCPHNMLPAGNFFAKSKGCTEAAAKSALEAKMLAKCTAARAAAGSPCEGTCTAAGEECVMTANFPADAIRCLPARIRTMGCANNQGYACHFPATSGAQLNCECSCY